MAHPKTPPIPTPVAPAAPAHMSSLEYLLGMAAVNSSFADALTRDPEATAEACGVKLSAAESAILMSADASRLQLLAEPIAERIPEPERRRFLTRAAQALAALAVGGAVLSQAPSETSARPVTEDEIRPWWDVEMAGGGGGGSGGGRVTGVRPQRPGMSREAPPLVRLSKVATKGSLSQPFARRLMRRYVPHFKYVYREELGRTLKVEGELDFAVLVGPSGKVESVKITRATVTHLRLHKRISSMIRRVRFPKPGHDKRRKRPRTADVTFTLKFVRE